MKDIAHATGYTVNTVSHALKDLPDISPETRRKIQETARDMGYVRNTMASALRSGRSHTLALIVGDLDNPKFAIMAGDIEAAARKLKYSLIILCAHENGEMEYQAIRTAIGRQVDGIILNPCQENDHCIAQLNASGIPYVLIERYFDEHNVDTVICDGEEGGYLAAMHLLAQGHQKIAHFHGNLRLSGATARHAGFLRAAEALPAGSARCLPLASGEENARAVEALRTESFTGFFIFNDMALWDILAHLREDCAVRERAAFVGFDNIQGKLTFPVPLCSIDPSSTALCEATVALLHRRIQGEKTPPERIVFPVSVVCRNHCRTGPCAEAAPKAPAQQGID